MTKPLRIQYPGAYYHITSRGNERKNIFRNNRDREQFLSYLKSAYLRYKAVIHAFCLMNNHYHLFLETPKGNLSQIMRHINGAYTNYFNIRHKRRGHLFQSRYKSIIVEADSYVGAPGSSSRVTIIRRTPPATDAPIAICLSYYIKKSACSSYLFLLYFSIIDTACDTTCEPNRIIISTSSQDSTIAATILSNSSLLFSGRCTTYFFMIDSIIIN